MGCRHRLRHLLAAPAWLRDTVAGRCNGAAGMPWIEPLAEWMADFIGREFALPDADVRFRFAGLTGVVAEMEFWIAARATSIPGARPAGVRTRSVAPVAARGGSAKRHAEGLHRPVAGARGRYYVVDYKSNWLGPDDALYNCEARMRQAVLEARYELQYSLTCWPCIDCCWVRLPGYDYEHHIGGAVYLFLRGSGSRARACISNVP